MKMQYKDVPEDCRVKYRPHPTAQPKYWFEGKKLAHDQAHRPWLMCKKGQTPVVMFNIPPDQEVRVIYSSRLWWMRLDDRVEDVARRAAKWLERAVMTGSRYLRKLPHWVAMVGLTRAECRAVAEQSMKFYMSEQGHRSKVQLGYDTEYTRLKSASVEERIAQAKNYVQREPKPVGLNATGHCVTSANVTIGSDGVKHG